MSLCNFVQNKVKLRNISYRVNFDINITHIIVNHNSINEKYSLNCMFEFTPVLSEGFFLLFYFSAFSDLYYPFQFRLQYT